LKNFDIIIFNYVPDTETDKLTNSLKKLYGDFEPVKSEQNVLRPAESNYNVSSYPLLNQTVLYYDEIENLKKPVPEKIEYFEIRIIKRIPGWNEVVCSGKLKEEYLINAKQEYSETREKKKEVALPNTIKQAHMEFEEYLSDYIMDNIIHKSDSEKRKNFAYLYVGEYEQLEPTNVIQLLEETHYTRGMLGWGIQNCFSLIDQYLVAPHGGFHTGLIVPQRGFSLLNTSPILRYKPNTHSEEVIRQIRAISYEHWIIDTISLILFSNILLRLRLNQIINWEKINAKSWLDVQKVLNCEVEKIDLKHLIPTHNEISKYRSNFLYESFIIKKECNDLTNPIKMCNGFLLAQDSGGYPRERAFSDSISFNEESNKHDWQYKVIEVGPLLIIVEKSEKLMDKLLSELNRIDEQQQNLLSHIDSLVNISMQMKMEKMTTAMTRLTVAIFILTACALMVSVLSLLS
jgi:hypothetical protein